MTHLIPLRQHGRMWGVIDTRNGLLRIKKQKLTAVFDLRLLMAEDVQALIPKPGSSANGEELPELGPGEGVEAVKRVAAASPFNGGDHG